MTENEKGDGSAEGVSAQVGGDEGRAVFGLGSPPSARISCKYRLTRAPASCGLYATRAGLLTATGRCRVAGPTTTFETPRCTVRKRQKSERQGVSRWEAPRRGSGLPGAEKERRAVCRNFSSAIVVSPECAQCGGGLWARPALGPNGCAAPGRPQGTVAFPVSFGASAPCAPQRRWQCWPPANAGRGTRGTGGQRDSTGKALPGAEWKHFDCWCA